MLGMDDGATALERVWWFLRKPNSFHLGQQFHSGVHPPVGRGYSASVTNGNEVIGVGIVIQRGAPTDLPREESLSHGSVH